MAGRLTMSTLSKQASTGYLYSCYNMKHQTLSSFPTWLLSCCTDEYVHTYNIPTYSVIGDCVSDSSSELRHLGSCVLRVCTLAIHTSIQHANAMLKKGLTVFQVWPVYANCYLTYWCVCPVMCTVAGDWSECSILAELFIAAGPAQVHKVDGCHITRTWRSSSDITGCTEHIAYIAWIAANTCASQSS